MKLAMFTLAAASLLVAAASLIRQHELSVRIAYLEHSLLEQPRTKIIQIETPSLPPLAVVTPPPAPRPSRHARKVAVTSTPTVALPECPQTDPLCGTRPK